MSDLPQGWVKAELGKFVELKYGKSLPVKDRNGGNIPVYGSNGQVGWHDIPLTKNQTIIIGRKGSIGEVVFSSVPCFSIDTTYYIDDFYGIEPIYLFHLLKSLKLQELDRSTGIPGINRNDVYKIYISIPPLAEQKRIVTKLDSLFAHTRRAREELDYIPKLIERYKQAILSAAFYGKLNIFSDIKNKKPITKNIRSLITKLDQGWSPKCLSSSSHNEHEWGVIKTTAIQDIYFNQNENKALPSHLEPRPNLEIVKGDVLITRAGPRNRVGICCYVDKTRKNLILCDKVYRLKVNLELIDPLYLTMILNSPPVKKLIEKMKSGISDSGLNLTQEKFLNLCIPYYSIAEQVSIIAEISKAFLQIDKIAIEAAKSAAFLDRLEQSTLAKAFRGEIVPQDPNDEPASILLERIQKERENQKTPKKRQLSLFKEKT